MIFLLFLVFYLHIAAIIFWTYKTKKTFLRWLCVIYPSMWLFFLFEFRFDILTCTLIWGPAFLGVSVLVFLLFIDIVERIKVSHPYFKARLTQTLMSLCIFVLAMIAHHYSRQKADQYAIQKAIEIQNLSKVKGQSPLKIEGWIDGDYIFYGKIGPDFPIMYTGSKTEFTVHVRHSIDDRLYIEGGINKPLRAFRVIESKTTDIPIPVENQK